MGADDGHEFACFLLVVFVAEDEGGFNAVGFDDLLNFCDVGFPEDSTQGGAAATLLPLCGDILPPFFDVLVAAQQQDSVEVLLTQSRVDLQPSDDDEAQEDGDVNQDEGDDDDAVNVDVGGVDRLVDEGYAKPVGGEVAQLFKGTPDGLQVGAAVEAKVAQYDGDTDEREEDKEGVLDNAAQSRDEIPPKESADEVGGLSSVVGDKEGDDKVKEGTESGDDGACKIHVLREESGSW